MKICFNCKKKCTDNVLDSRIGGLICVTCHARTLYMDLMDKSKDLKYELYEDESLEDDSYYNSPLFIRSILEKIDFIKDEIRYFEESFNSR
jgi:hypothetical protein